MDDGGENISWVENLFQKLQDMYLEVDVAVREEMRNVENHLQTIGANVVDFYRDMVLDEPPQSSEDVVEEAADDSIDILVSDASKLRIDEVHHEEETKKEVARDIGYLVSYTSEMDTDEDHQEEDTEEEDDASGTDNDEDYYEEDTEEEADDASEIVTNEDYFEEDSEEEADDASEIYTDEYDSEEDTEEETYDASEIYTDEYDSEEDTEEETYDASDIETYKYNSEEDTKEEALYDNDVLVPGASKTVSNKGLRKVLLEFHKLISSDSVEPTDEAQYDSCLQQKVDSGVYEKTKMIAEENLAKKKEESISKKKDSSLFVVANSNEFGRLLSSFSVNEFESCESKGLDVELTPGNASTVSPVADESIAEAILDDDDTEVEKDIIDAFESMKIDENRDMKAGTEFEITGKNEEEGMLGLRKKKTIKLFGVTVETPDDEFCDSEWLII